MLIFWTNLIAVGDSVSEDEVIGEVETDKVRHLWELLVY
jgi:hypothetical protein